MNILKKASMLFATVFLVSCVLTQGAKTTPVKTSPPPIPTSTPQPVFGKTKTPTTHSVDALLTPTYYSQTVIPTVDTADTGNPQTQCLDIMLEPPPNTTIPGSLLLNSEDVLGQSMLFDIDERKITEISSDYSCYSSSPDGNWFLCIEQSADFQSDPGRLVFLSADKKQKRIFSLQFGTVLNDWLSTDKYSVSPTRTRERIPPVIIYDPQTGDKEFLYSNYPGLEPYDGAAGSPFHFPGRSVVYDPTLEYVVYPQTTPTNQRFLVLWNRKAEKAIASIEDQGYFRNDPQWSQDGARVFVVVATIATNTMKHEELFQMDLRGQVHQLTHFDKSENVDIELVAVSPDGDQLVFWVTEDDVYNPLSLWRMLVLDVASQEIKDLCVLNVREAGNVVFSPDGKFISTYIGPSSSDDPSRVIIIDLLNEWAMQVTTSVILEGWVKAP